MSSRVLKNGVNRITQGHKSTHRGVDLGRVHAWGEPVIAHTAGTVVFCQTGHKNNRGATGNASYGNCVKLRHSGGYETLYAHLASVKVKHGQVVQTGQVLGTMGNTGNSYGTHLHFEVRRDGSRINPTPYLAAALPTPEPIAVTYRVYVGGRWLPWVTNWGTGADGYAGIYGKPITAVQIRPTAGVLRYRVHQNGAWLPWVTSQSSWAGVRGVPVDALQAVWDGDEGYAVRYCATSLGNSTWHRWCTDAADDTGDGYAGVFGKPLDGLRMEIVSKGE